MDEVIDLRSDTVTLPTQEMRQAMYDAEVGDDTTYEDPTVIRLEELAADMVGKEASLFMVSGTMGNLVSMLSHCARGDEVLMGDNSHIFFYEVGGASTVGSLPIRTAPNDRFGRIPTAELEDCIRGDDIHFPVTGLICIEDTHNRRGGTVLPLEYLQSAAQVARGHSLPIHVDGARIFNAAAYLGVDVREITQYVDSVMFCLSKGLSAPVGSMLAGSREFIRRARKNRKVVGGQMRQGGVIAAAGIVALTKMVDRLPEDHATARRLAVGLAEIKGLELDMETVQTNIVVSKLTKPGLSPHDLQARLRQKGVRVSLYGGPLVRFVTHHGIDMDHIDSALVAVQSSLDD